MIRRKFTKVLTTAAAGAALTTALSTTLFGVTASAQAQEVIRIGAPLALTGGLADTET